MSKWEAVGVTYGRGKRSIVLWVVFDKKNQDSKPLFFCDKKNLSEKIVREHNAHAELVLCLKAMLKITCGECRGENPGSCPADPVSCALSAQARAAIESAEGKHDD